MIFFQTVSYLSGASLPVNASGSPAHAFSSKSVFRALTLSYFLQWTHKRVSVLRIPADNENQDALAFDVFARRFRQTRRVQTQHINQFCPLAGIWCFSKYGCSSEKQRPTMAESKRLEHVGLRLYKYRDTKLAEVCSFSPPKYPSQCAKSKL